MDFHGLVDPVVEVLIHCSGKGCDLTACGKRNLARLCAPNTSSKYLVGQRARARIDVSALCLGDSFHVT